MLTMLRNSISPCLNTALLVTSTVNQGRTPLLQDKIREVWNAQQWFNPLWTGQNWTVVFGDLHHFGQILRPPESPIYLMYPRGPKYSRSFGKSSSQSTRHLFSQRHPAHQGFLRTQVSNQPWGWVTERASMVSPLCYLTDGLKEWVSDSWLNSSDLGGAKSSKTNIFSPKSTSRIWMLHKLHLFCFCIWILISQEQYGWSSWW